MNAAIVSIREERPGDHSAVYTLVQDAFAPMPYAGGDEQDLINVLRDKGKLTLALVAELNQVVVGHIAFSIARAVDSKRLVWALGPVAVAPDLQRLGIGARLIEQGLQRARAAGVVACVLTGNPDYYRRFGFELAPDNVPPQESADFFMLKVWKDSTINWPIAFDPCFYTISYDVD